MPVLKIYLFQQSAVSAVDMVYGGEDYQVIASWGLSVINRLSI